MNNGIIYQINVKPNIEGERGIPKFSRDSAYVSFNGIDGDYNHFRRTWKFNTASRALLVFPKETYIQLQKEGWSVCPGDLGENITTEDIPYENFELNSMWKAGEIEIQISESCRPCKVLSHLHDIGKEKVKEFVKTLVGRRGLYAKVLREGTIKKGDLIERIT